MRFSPMNTSLTPAAKESYEGSGIQRPNRLLALCSTVVVSKSVRHDNDETARACAPLRLCNEQLFHSLLSVGSCWRVHYILLYGATKLRRPASAM